MRVDLFDFDLPENLIALRPARPRDSARLLRVKGDGLDNWLVSDLPGLLRAGDALVVNTTKVIPARLVGVRQRIDQRDGTSGARVEITLIKRLGPVDWQCFLKPAKRVKNGDVITFNDVTARVCERVDGSARLVFEIAPDQMEPILAALGTMPLPLYIASKRTIDWHDTEDYQTLFASQEGAVAAPTAGLHFTPELVKRLREKNIALHEVTLHVGSGTFLPVKATDTQDHKMHGEWGQISVATATSLNAVRRAGGRVICVGTTCLRLLESAATRDGKINPFEAETDIFITPGYAFRAADMLLTNFHLPRSTLFMLVSAFSGLDNMQRAYAHAITEDYRFYSYGDACLLERVAA